MTFPLIAVAPLLLAGVLIAAAVGKLRHPEDEAAWAELGVPAVLRRGWLMRLHPWAELLLAVALLLFGGVLGALAGAAASLLFAVYLILIVRARAQDGGASCSCFGGRQPITTLTVIRNSWYLLIALVAAATLWMTPLLGGAVSVLGGQWGWALALAAAALTVWLGMGQHSADAPVSAGVPVIAGQRDGGEPGEYLRQRTPAVPVQLADGRTVNLRQLAMRGPILLLAVKEGCGSCSTVIAAVPAWRALLPELDVRLLLWPLPDQSSLTEHEEPQSLHDPYMYVSGSIDDWPTPSAVLIGADGYLAGGPVSGAEAIEEFVGDVYESLHGIRPPART